MVILAFAVLLALGTWQVKRSYWKDNLMRDIHARATGAPIAPPISNADTIRRYQRARTTGVWLHEAEIHLAARIAKGEVGYHVVTPLRLEDGRILLANRGWVAAARRFSFSRPETLTQGWVEVDGVIRLPYKKGFFVPSNIPQNDDWFTLDIVAISAHFTLGDNVIHDYTLEVIRSSENDDPVGSTLTPNLTNNHRKYALTWYGLALGLIGVYCAWHIQTGRLRWHKP